MKDGSGDWANMTSVDKDGWPNWATHTYYGPGIDDDQHVTTASSPDKHGLLSAPGLAHHRQCDRLHGISHLPLLSTGSRKYPYCR